MTRVTLDSNIYLSALVFGGKPKRILEMAIEGEIEVAVSDLIIEEVQRHLLGKFGCSRRFSPGCSRGVFALGIDETLGIHASVRNKTAAVHCCKIFFRWHG